MKQGDRIYYIEIGGSIGATHILRESTIETVGKKYFTVVGVCRARFYIDTLIHENGRYSPSIKIYLSIDEYTNERRRSKALKEIRHYFGNYGNVDSSTSNLVDICNILNIEI